MDAKEKIRELRMKTGMNRREFSDFYGIPLRTIEEWEAGRRAPAEYIVRLLAYAVEYDLVERFEGPEAKDMKTTEETGDDK